MLKRFHDDDALEAKDARQEDAGCRSPDDMMPAYCVPFSVPLALLGWLVLVLYLHAQ